MNHLERLWPLILVLLGLALVFGTGLNRYLSLETVQAHGEDMQAFVSAHYLPALLLLMLLFAALTASVVPGVFFVTITAGYLFGPWVGGIATSVAATLGALAVYAVARTTLGESLRRRMARGGLLDRVCASIDRNTFWYVLASRLAVVVPFHMINVAAGLMAVRLGPYSVATVIGLLPAHMIYCWIGSRLGELLKVDPDPDLKAMFAQFWAPLAGVFVLAVVLPLLLRAGRAHVLRRRST